MLGLLSQQLVEQQALDDDRLAGQQGGGGDRGSCGSGGQDETTYNSEDIRFVFHVFFCISIYILYSSNKLTGGSEGHADGVDDGSGSPGDGEEAARQSEDDKALWDSGIIFCILYFLCQSEDDKALWIFEN